MRENVRYLGGRKRLPLRRAVPKPLARDAGKNAWISAAMWRLVDERVSACQDLEKDQALIRRLGRSIKASLWDESRQRAEEAGAVVEALTGSDPQLHREAWHRIKG